MLQCILLTSIAKILKFKYVFCNLQILLNNQLPHVCHYIDSILIYYYYYYYYQFLKFSLLFFINAIPEAESRFESSPSQVYSSKKPEPTRPVIDLKVQEQPKPILPKKKSLKKVDYKILALIRIQASCRRYLAQKRLEVQQIENFKNKSADPAKHLKLVKQGVFKASGMFFMYFLYTDEYKEFVKVTIRSVQPRKVVLNLKKIVLSEFGEDAEIDELNH